MCLWTVDIDTKSLNAYLKSGRGETSCYNISKYKNETEKNSAIMLFIYLDVSEDCWPHRCD